MGANWLVVLAQYATFKEMKMTQMVDRQKAHWRIIYNATWGSLFPYRVEYDIGSG